MTRHFAGNIVLYTDIIQAENDLEYANIINGFMADIKQLPAYEQLITRYGVNITYASQPKESQQDA